jgi:anaerobic magnesium-protoporphyrin IX monomethyl ester cyclase
MNILLISSPMKSPHYSDMVMQSLGLLSIASNLDPKHSVRIVDTFEGEGRCNLTDIINHFQPAVIGLSCMVFQYESIRNMAIRIKSINQSIKTVLGGYFATLMYQEFFNSDDKTIIDYLIRNEGEIAFNLLVNALEDNSDLDRIPNLSYMKNGTVYHNKTVEIESLESIKLPDRKLTSNNTYRYFNQMTYTDEHIATIETSRGCKHACNYCSLKKMYSKPYRAYPLERVIEDIKNIEKFQKKTDRIFFIDDNLTNDIQHLEKLCDLIIGNKLNKYKYMAQCSSFGISGSESMVNKMRAAGFDHIFLGIENNNTDNLKFLGKGNISDKTRIACDYLYKNDIVILGGIMVGCPDDDEKSIKDLFMYLDNLRVYHPELNYIIPFPKTMLRDEYLKENLIDEIDDFIHYSGDYPIIHTKKLSNLQLFKIGFIEQRKFDIFKTLLKWTARKCLPESKLRYRLSFIKSALQYFGWRIIHIFDMDKHMNDRLSKMKAGRLKDAEVDHLF